MHHSLMVWISSWRFFMLTTFSWQYFLFVGPHLLAWFFSFSFFLYVNFCSYWDMNLKPPTNPFLPLPLELDLKGFISWVLDGRFSLRMFYLFIFLSAFWCLLYVPFVLNVCPFFLGCIFITTMFICLLKKQYKI